MLISSIANSMIEQNKEAEVDTSDDERPEEVTDIKRISNRSTGICFDI